MKVPLQAVRSVGSGLKRPECVLAHRSGLLFAADWTGNGGVAIVASDGTVTRLLSAERRVRPNGIALEDGGSFLLAHLDDAEGGVFRLHPDGRLDPILTEVGGRPLPPTNFVAIDPNGRLYVAVSTALVPRHRAANAHTRDGFIVMVPPVGRPTIVAEGLGYTNEAILSVDGTRLFVNETFGRATAAFAVRSDGTLGPREVLVTYDDGVFPDGLALDEDGGLWVTSIVSNTVLRLDPDGASSIILADRDEAFVRAVEDAWRSGTLDRGLLDRAHTGLLRNVSSLAFGGAELRTAYLGCLLGDAIAAFETAHRGLPPLHYDARLDGLVEARLIRREPSRCP